MSYLGRKGASAILTSADIPAGSVSAVKVASDVATQAELDAQKTNSSITTLGTVTAGNISHADLVYPAGHVVQVVFNSMAPATISTTTQTYQTTSIYVDIQKKFNSSRCLVNVSGGHMYVNSGYPDGVASTICGQSSSTTFTHGTTYASGDDPASGEAYGMQQLYNGSNLHSTSHSKQHLFVSSGNEFESFRVFYKSRNGNSVTIHELNHRVSITVMEIKQ
jgi:hypothetical protein